MIGDLTEYIHEIRKAVSERIDLTQNFDDEDIKRVINEIVSERSKEKYLTLDEKIAVMDGVYNSMRRLDVLQPLIDDKTITEIMINGPKNIFIERGGRVSKAPVSFPDEVQLENVIQTIVAKVNRTVNDSTPIADARLENGSRVNVVLPPIALNGPIVTIRKFPDKPMSVDDLVNKYRSLTPEAAEYLEMLVKAKYNIIISGGTGSGKTTFLNAMSSFIPADERVITIEDSAELQITGIENLVRLETRNANTEGKGEITIRDLIRSSLRMRPERIVVGEVRGAEALDMLQAMNTGHDGSLSTGHANSSKDMLSRLETMVLQGAQIPLDAIRRQIASAVDIIVQLSRLRDKSRRTVEITEVLDYKNGEIILNPLFVFEETGEDEKHNIIGALKRTDNKLVNTHKLIVAGMREMMER